MSNLNSEHLTLFKHQWTWLFTINETCVPVMQNAVVHIY